MALTIKIGGREIPLFCSSYEMLTIQEEIGCTLAQLRDEVFGLHQKDEDENDSWYFDVAVDPERLKKFGTLLRILGNAGLEEAGKDPDLTDKWVLRSIKPGMILPYSLTVMAEINAAQRSEVAEAAQKEQTGPVDVMVEEENRKKAPEK